MAIKQLTFSALTGGALVLAYAAWSKLRGGPPKISSAPVQNLEAPLSASQPLTPARADGSAEPLTGSEAEGIDVALDDLWAVDEAPDSKEQLVDFSSDIEFDDDEVSVAPEGLGVRWLTRATESMSPFNRELSVREEAEAALRAGGAPPSRSDDSMTQDRGPRGGAR